MRSIGGVRDKTIRCWPPGGVFSSSNLPRWVMPVPQSRMMVFPCGVPISTQGVFPPHLKVLGPGDGIEPRTPQKVTCIAAPVKASSSPRHMELYLRRGNGTETDRLPSLVAHIIPDEIHLLAGASPARCDCCFSGLLHTQRCRQVSNLLP